ncbi:hypothetical protein RKD21_005132 [Streptomyces albogriseolus]|uniref:Uncharacterized protein n=1 Tax=Streptomyces albogriseolus TaxID=1887 RepID=A0ACC6UTS7_STRAO
MTYPDPEDRAALYALELSWASGTWGCRWSG